MSKNFNHPQKYEGLINNPLTIDEVNTIYSVYNVKAVKVDLYYDMIQSLCCLVTKSYLGDKHHKTKVEKLEHFKWCFNKVMSDYGKMGYQLKSVGKLYNYFEDFFLEVYYEQPTKDVDVVTNIENVLEYFFDYNIVKSKVDVHSFLEIYYMFNN